jgi:RNA polymerase sigma-70 factor, ECF subfamily
MRRILVDYARKHRARKRQAELVDLDEAAPIAAKPRTDLIALDEALIELEKIDRRKSQVVVMKYFGGMTDVETAETLGISTATVTREWQTAKGKLLEIMSRA